MAKEWLRDCSLKHERCQNRASQHIPTRLVGTAMGRCRVYQRDELNAGVEYATLSHCWGRTRYLTLSKNNLQQLKTQIPSEDLSRTVQDAITIAHDLGFEYIWVDTLCIIQDDLADWKREAASMTSVYENSSLNIAAAGARDGRDGCFFSRPTHWNCKLQLYNSQHTLEYSAAPVSLYSQCLIDMPLMERGWVLQERLLAVRTLHFTTTELFWECNHTTACESFPERLPGDMRMSSRFLHKKTINDSMWPWIIARYSACKLTYVKDKLVAISGLARKIHQQTNDQYVAGLWRKHLEAQLCWFIWIPGPRRETEAYIAPSWSWASVDVPVHTNHVSLLDRPVLISVVDVKIGYTEFDSFGTINSATMRVRCCGLHRASFDGSTNELLLPGNKGVTGGTVMPDNSPDGGDETIQEGLLLPVFVDNGNDEAIIGLVLKLSGQGKGVYRRVGRFCVSLKESLIDTLGQIVDDGYGHLSRTYAEVLRDDSGVTLGYMIDII
ncbi:heterokaryon incompatibility protein-domain-containing protein [Bipolaris maydis]|nr:heterokaryon incompatibility protein-domain-containing protein [Bipolaris maydis]